MSTPEHNVTKTDDGSDAEDYATKIRELDQVIQNAFIEFNAQEATDDSTKEDYFKKRNALYSQRKYYRSKQKIETLLAEKKELEEKNTAARVEQDLLETLLSWARAQIRLYENGSAPSSSLEPQNRNSAPQNSLDVKPPAVPRQAQKRLGAHTAGGTFANPLASVHPSARTGVASMKTPMYNSFSVEQVMGANSGFPPPSHSTVSPSLQDFNTSSRSQSVDTIASTWGAIGEDRRGRQQKEVVSLLEELALIDHLIKLSQQAPETRKAPWQRQGLSTEGIPVATPSVAGLPVGDTSSRRLLTRDPTSDKGVFGFPWFRQKSYASLPYTAFMKQSNRSQPSSRQAVLPTSPETRSAISSYGSHQAMCNLNNLESNQLQLALACLQEMAGSVNIGRASAAVARAPTQSRFQQASSPPTPVMEPLSNAPESVQASLQAVLRNLI